MVSFADKYGGLTVKQVKELNALTNEQKKMLSEAAKWFCDHEVTAEGGE